jgi:hypothetical protein
MLLTFQTGWSLSTAWTSRRTATEAICQGLIDDGYSGSTLVISPGEIPTFQKGNSHHSKVVGADDAVIGSDPCLGGRYLFDIESLLDEVFLSKLSSRRPQ